MKHVYIKTFLLLVFSFTSIPGIYSQSTVTTVVNYSGFQACGGCTVCGADYWCTNTPGSYCGNTNPCMDMTFFDPVPAGNVITGITVNYWTASCDGAAIYGTFANSSSNEFVMPVAYDGNSGCLCSSLPCMLTTSSSISFPCGIPGYIYGGNNIFKICSSGPMCINRAEIVFTYWNVSVVTPTITASNNPICAGEATTLTASNSGFTSYLWSTGATTQSITVSPTTTTTYGVTVSTATGCTTANASITITVNPTPTITANASPATICSGQCTNLTAGGASTYYWLPGMIPGSTYNVCPTATTTYTVGGVNAAGCTNSTTVSVNVNPSAVTPTFNPVGPYCSGAAIPALPTTSTNGITGTWSPAINNTATTTYTFTPAAGQCATTTTLTITINPNTTPTFNPVGPYCSGAAIPALPTTSTNGITGTWSPAINNTATTTYTFTPTAGLCATTTTLTITINPNTTPTFNPVGPYCSGAVIPALPTTSTNGITGTWSPAINNTATTTYTFTPTPGLCATTTTLTITINPNVTPTFNAVGPYCSGAAIPALPTTSTNGITGTWSPAINNTATTTYTFTPTAGQCATTTTLTININFNTTPTFNPVGPYCSGAAIPALPTTSTNGITGSWSPAINNTATTTYTFTPNAGQCAINTTLTITINPNTTPTFNPVGPYCSGAAIPALPTTSTNGITGTWSPAINNTATTTYTFTPTAGLCATTTTLTITINPNTTPTFNPVGPYCSGAVIPALPTTSTNGITGTWSPAINNTATTTYTFTPTPGLCATTTTLTITINPNVTPTFNAVGPYCSGAAIPALPTTSTNGITGTWSPAINNTATTTYTFTPTAGQCATTTTLTINVNFNTTPTFNPVGPYCSGAAIPALPTTSTNGITGSWSPAINNTTTTTYTFTPTPGLCATTTTLTITINPNVTPTFNAVGPYCSGAIVPALPTTSTNGITGTWSPAINNTATTTYTFTPTPGLCATTTTLTVTIDPNITPTFNAVGPYCSGAGIPALPTTSTNGITGTWSPAINNTTTTTYTFAPTPGLCATSSNLTITINPNVTPTFNAVGPYCSGTAIAALPTTSTNGITGTWSPAINNTATTTYTFTPTPGLCATTTTLTIAIDPGITPTFNTVGPYCSGAAIPALPTTSTNGITGTWSPAINNTATTSYIFTPTPGLCAPTTSMTIVVNPLPTANAGADQSTGACTNSTPANLTGSGTGTNPLSYSWTPTAGVNNPAVAVTTAHPFSTTVYTLVVTDPYGCSASDNVVVTVAPAPTANAGPDAAIGTCSWSVANLNGSATGATPFGYSWTPVTGLTNSYIANPQAHPPTTTVYTLTVTDTYGCTAQDFTTVSVSPLPVVSIAASPSTICPTFSSTLNAFGALTYAWTPATGLSATTGQVVTATPPSTTTYTVTGSDQFTCTASAQATVTVNPTPVVTVTPASPAICAGDNVTLTANGASSYTWVPIIGLSSTNTPVVSASPTSTITYTVTGMDLGCSGTTTVTVTVNPLPTVTFATVNDVCLNDTPFTLTQGSPAGGSYTGPGITNTNTFNPSIAGVGTHLITYTYTDNNNCVNSATQNIVVKPNPVMTVTPDNVSICLGTSVAIVANGADTYLWSPDNTLSSSTGNAVTATPVSTTVYTVVGTIDGCTASESAIVNTYTTIPIAVTPLSDSLCPGEATMFTASGAFNYTWLPAEGLSSNSTPTVICTPTATTVYTVLGSDNDGCTGSASVAAVIYPEAFLNFTVVPHEGCTPLAVEFTYTPDGTLDTNTLHWNFGDLLSVNDVSNHTSDTYTYNSQGNYFIMLTGTSAHGCNAVGYDTVFAFKSPEASFYANPEVADINNPLIGFYDESYYTTHWSWDFGDPQSDELNSSDLQFPQHLYSDSGTFTVMLIASNDYNCSDTAVRTVKINEAFVYYVPNAFTPNENGVNDGFIGKGVGYLEEGYEMYIFDRWGKKMFYTQDCTEPWDGYNASGTIPCETGVYVWLVNITEISGIKHVLKGTVTLYR